MGNPPFRLVCLFIGFSGMLVAQDAPPNAQPGKCYAKCIIPAQYETVTDQVVIKPAGKRSVAVPAMLEPKTIDLVVKESSKRYIPVP
ncbi:MAG: hypothetical protein Q7U74_06240, partial [Saprospiraceae bacterium]|nr:hypothetical protein [Saprospiraceae bacterium]